MFGFAKKPAAANLAASVHDEKLKFAVIINSIEDGVMMIDPELTIQLCNPGADAITGWNCNEATGINIGQVVPLVNGKGEPYPPDQDPFKAVFDTAQIVHDNKAIIANRSGKQIPINLTVTPLLDENRNVTAAIVVFRNVAAQRAEEQQRADFISTASHEMRTPVAAIEGYLALALNEKVSTIDARARGYLEKAHSSTQHLGQLFQDLLTSAKAEDGRLTSHPKVIEFGSFLEQLSNDLRLVANKKNLITEFNLGTAAGGVIDATAGHNTVGGEKIIRPLYYVYADPDRIREVITNIFDNACKYTPEGKITLGLTGDDHVVQCYVRDTGPGIPSDDLPHLFQKFYRVDNSSTRTVGGTGLGLFICRKIVELYKGRIWAESEVGKGSTFYINLPRLSTSQAQKLQANEQQQPILSEATQL